MNRVILSPEYFPDPTKGRPISNAKIFIGEPDLDPEVEENQKQVSVQQESGAIVGVSQPVLTGAGGVPLYQGSPVTLLVDGSYSLKVNDSGGSQIYYIPTVLGVDAANVSSYANLRVLSAQDEQIAYVAGRNAAGDGGAGNFVFDSSDLSTEVTSDPQSGIYVAPDSDLTGASGAWVRQYEKSLNVVWFGAKGDGVTDDTTAIQSAVNLASNTLSVFFPNTEDYYVVSSSIVIDTTCSIFGESVFGSAVRGNFADALFKFNSSSGKTLIQNFWLHNTNASGIGVQWNQAHRSAGKNIHMGAGHLGIGFDNQGTQQLYLENCYVSTNGTQRFSGASPNIGFNFIAGVGGATVNASTLHHCHAAGCAKGLIIDGSAHGDTLAAYMNVSYCVFQGNTTLDMELIEIDGARFDHVHIEGSGGVSLNTINSCAFTDLIVLGSTTMTACESNSFFGGLFNNILTDSNCEFNTWIGCALGNGSTAVVLNKNNNNTNRTINCSFDNWDAGGTIHRPDNTQSYTISYNGYFEYWNSGNTAPLGWSSHDSGTLSRETTGEVTGTYALKITSPGGVSFPGVEFDLTSYHGNVIPRPADVSPEVAGGYISVAALVRRPTGQTTIPRIGVFQGFYIWKPDIAAEIVDDEYVWLRASFPVGNTGTKVVITVGENAAINEYIDVDCVNITVGQNTHAVYQQADYESKELTVLGGKRTFRGTAAPVSGDYVIGDIVLDDTPTAGGFIGWVCVTSGNPGVWKTYGSISA